jgi:hypothetical protein
MKPHVCLALTGLVLAACDSDARAPAGDEQGGADRAVVAPAAVATATVPADPCGWIPAEQVAALIGPLEGQAERVRSVEQTKPDTDGTACLYRLAAKPRLGGPNVLVEVSPAAGVLYERAAGAMREHFAAALRDGSRASEPAKPAEVDEGWDYSGYLPMGLGSYIGRAGHVSVLVVSQSPDVPRASLSALAAAIRGRIPDLPFPLPPDPVLEELNRMEGAAPEAPPSGPDPCGLLTRAEAEAVLGKLVVEPYRSSESTPLADPYGKGCTYFAAGHRTLVLKPHWDSGRMMFDMARGVGGAVASVLPAADGEPADTLDGPWDEAAANGTTGDLYFVKGDRMLELGYLTSSTDAAGALRLAQIAVERL